MNQGVFVHFTSKKVLDGEHWFVLWSLSKTQLKSIINPLWDQYCCTTQHKTIAKAFFNHLCSMLGEIDDMDEKYDKILKSIYLDDEHYRNNIFNGTRIQRILSCDEKDAKNVYTFCLG